jgi:hypothetical protein
LVSRPLWPTQSLSTERWNFPKAYENKILEKWGADAPFIFYFSVSFLTSSLYLHRNMATVNLSPQEIHFPPSLLFPWGKLSPRGEVIP